MNSENLRAVNTDSSTSSRTVSINEHTEVVRWLHGVWPRYTSLDGWTINRWH